MHWNECKPPCRFYWIFCQHWITSSEELERGKWILGRYFAHDPTETWGKGDPSQLNLFHDRFHKFVKSSFEILRKKSLSITLYMYEEFFLPQRLKSVWKKSILISINPMQFLLQNPTNQSLPLVLSKNMKRNECLLNSLMEFNCF